MANAGSDAARPKVVLRTLDRLHNRRPNLPPAFVGQASSGLVSRRLCRQLILPLPPLPRLHQRLPRLRPTSLPPFV